MRSRWLVASLLVVLMLAPSVSAAWYGHRGEPGHSGTTRAIADPFDVLTYGRLGNRDESIAIRIQENAGPVVDDERLRFVDNTRTCQRYNVRIDGLTERGPGAVRDVTNGIDWDSYEGCSAGSLHAAAPDAGAQFMCSTTNGDDPIAWRIRTAPDGVDWSVTPSGLGINGTEVYLPITCRGGVLDHAGEVFYAAFAEINQGQVHRIAAIDAEDGTVLWSRPIPYHHLQPEAYTAAGAVPDTTNQEIDRLKESAQGTVEENAESVMFTPWSLTLFGDDVLVVGRTGCGGFNCPPARAAQSVAVWLDGETGRPRGSAFGTQLAEAGTRTATAYHSGTATARNGVAAVALGDQTHLIVAGASEAASVLPLKAPIGAGGFEMPGAAWSAHGLVIATHAALEVRDAAGQELRTLWSAPPGHAIADLLLVDDGTALVLTHDPADTTSGEFVRIRLDDGQTLQRVPYPQVTPRTFIPTGGSGFQARMMPLDDGRVLTLDGEGRYTVLGARGDGSGASVSDRFPAPSQVVRLRLSEGDYTEFRVVWGDGAEDRPGPGDVLDHSYATPGAHRLVVTGRLDDNTTRSTLTVIQVGGHDLNLMQTIFAPENADVTYGVIGVLIAVFGGLMAVARSRVRKNRLESKLAYLEKLKAQAVHDVPGAIEGIEAYRMQVRHELKRGKLDDIQYSVLDGEIQKTLRALRSRLLAPFEGRMTKRYQRLLSSALEDGILSEKEADALLNGLERERRLRDDEKDRLAGFLMTWAMRQVPRGTSA